MSGGQPAIARGNGLERVLGRYDGKAPGPTVVVVAGMHGNEPSGVQAFRTVFQHIVERRLRVRGSVIGVAGNLPALAAGRRFVSCDLNRLWTAERVERMRAADMSTLERVEDIEQRELLQLFDGLASKNGRSDLVFLDLHSTSGDGPPFHCISDTLHSRAIAIETPIPLILGVEESIRGSLLDFMEERGWPLILMEGGQHDDPQTVPNHEAALWHALVILGSLDAADVPELASGLDRLRRAAGGVPRVVEVRHRHPVEPGDRFRMRPGYRNFQPVERGEVVADDSSGPIRVPESGLLLMPLYQEQGDDGFFVARPVRRVWLGFSTVLRTLRVDRLLPHLPGVRRDPVRPTRLYVNPHIARWFTVQLFHLLGFRRLPDRGEQYVFTRRVEG